MSEDGSKKGMTRRELLRTGVVATVGLSIGCGGGMGAADAGGLDAPLDPDAGPPEVDGGTDAGPPDAGPEQVPPPESVEPSASFPLGVASGDATPESAIFWTRYDGAAPIELVVWEMDGESYARTVHAGEVEPVSGFVHADVAALAAGLRYRYCFFEKTGAERTSRSPIGRMRAAIGSSAMEPLLLGAVSCTNNSRTPAPLGHAGGREDLDLFLWLGDTTYNDGARSLAEYRAKWDENLSKTEFRAVRAATSALATWDDHELDNDWNPETVDAGQRANAVQSFFEHQPLRRDAASPDRIYKRMRWGRTAELFVLDCRGERRPSTRSTPSAEYLSRAQMDWLRAGLSASSAVFKIILNSVPITDFPGLFDVAPNDRWEGYAAQRLEILRHIDDSSIRGVVWLAGDFHLACAGRVATSGPGATQVEILAGPGAQTGNPLAATLTAPQFDFQTTTNNYTVLELDPSRGLCRVWWYDGSGSVIETREYTVL